MNNDQPIPNSLTRQFTDLPEYKDKEEHQTTCPCSVMWQSQEQLTPEALNNIAKVESALKLSELGMNSPIFAGIELSVVTMRREFMDAASAEMMPRFRPESQLLSKQIKEITKEIKEAAQASASFEEQKTAILSKLAKTSEALIDFRDKVMNEKKELESLPLAKDPRTLKRNIRPFDKLGLHHQNYLKQLEEWKQMQLLVCDASEFDCWKWKGKMFSIKILSAQCAQLENSIHAAECCLTALQSNLNNEQFRQRPSANQQGSRVFLANLFSAFLNEDSFPSRPTEMPSPFSFGFGSSSPFAMGGMPSSNRFGTNFQSRPAGMPTSFPFSFGTGSPFATAGMPSSFPFGSSFPSNSPGMQPPRSSGANVPPGKSTASPTNPVEPNASPLTALTQEEQQQVLLLIISLVYYHQINQNSLNNGR